ncbi:uncharacterized protein Bfra_009148 [Botrytis fragariae]|uniref:2EXR domain-containing protein n=1 Tax=Botrytis fragariae TaxID=1964551 RepID=A0A8H6ARF3_9HELO|nr:uncharacterized protein Bfra_009148 [Botrytis fragariae]KAF5872119.1 hypothetical protein Bfra_009148 [Botrytis fragariae]
MNPNNASEKSAADQLATLAIPQQMNGSTSSTQHQDRNFNEQNCSLGAIDQIAHTEEVVGQDTKVDVRNKDAPALKSAPETFEQFRDLPTELRLRIWKFAGLQPRIIHVTNYNNTWPENIYLCPSMPQQCPLTMTCIESRGVVLKFKKPLQGLVLRSKTYMEDAERRGPYTPGTELDSQNFGQVEAEMLRREQPIIYANLDIDVIWPHTGECWTDMVHPLGGVYRDPGMKRIIVPKNKHNYPAKVVGVMPRLLDNRSLGVYQWAKSLDAQELYFLQDDEDFSIIEESTQVSHPCDGFVSEASLTQLVWGGDEMRGSLEDIHEAHKKGFNDSRNFTIRCFQQDLVKSGRLDGEDQRELQRLLAWEPPKIKYIKESQIKDIL